MVGAVLAVRAPELMILYVGHNDYNYAYRAAVLPAYGFIEGSTPLDFLVRSLLVPLFHLDDNLYWAMRSENIDPQINRELQRLGIVRIDADLVDAIDAQAQRHFEKNVETMIAEAKRRGVPVLLITPVSNLECEPFGVGSTALDEYRLGMRSSDYAARITHLRRARDLDAFNGFKRAKSAVGEYMRRRRGPGVQVLDLEQRLIEQRFEFGYGPFLDQMHLSPEAHSIVADAIYALLHEEKVCCGLGESDTSLVKPIPGP
jgi:lysophospholipase L1-like esterase